MFDNMNDSGRKASMVRRFVARFSKFAGMVGILFSVTAASVNPESTMFSPPTCARTLVQTIPSSLKLSESSSSLGPKFRHVYVPQCDIRHIEDHECETPITFDFWDHCTHRGRSRETRRRGGIANPVLRYHGRMNLKRFPQKIQKNSGVGVPRKRKYLGYYRVFPSRAHPPDVTQTSATISITKPRSASKTLLKTCSKKKTFEACASSLKQRFSITITILPAPALLTPTPVTSPLTFETCGPHEVSQPSSNASLPAAIPFLSYHDFFSQQIKMADYLFDQILANTTNQTEMQTFSQFGFGSTILEIPVPEDFEDILPEEVTPDQMSSSPTCTTPTTPSSSFSFDSFAGSPSVLTPTSSRSSPQPTASPSPKDHVEVKDTPSASDTRKGQKHYSCRCSKRYKRHCDLTKHILRFDRVHPCPYKECEYYTKKWSTKKDLERHLDSIHGSPQRRIRCGIEGCQATKTRKDNMRDHVKRKHCKTRPDLVTAMMAKIMGAHEEWNRQ